MMKTFLFLLFSICLFSSATHAQSVEDVLLAGNYYDNFYTHATHSSWNNAWVPDAKFTIYFTGTRADSAGAFVLPSLTLALRSYLSYSAQGQITHMITYSLNGSNWVETEADTILYNPDGTIASDTARYSDPTPHSDSYTYVNGKRTERFEQVFENGQWINDDRFFYSYDANGYLSSILDQNWQGTWVTDHRELWSYSESGKFIELIKQDSAASGWVNKERLTNDDSATSVSVNIVASGITVFDTMAGTTQTHSITLTNKGAGSVMIPSYSFRGGTLFSAADTSSHLLAAGDSTTIAISFAPLVSGIFYDTLVIGSAEAPLATVVFSGTSQLTTVGINNDTTTLHAMAGASDTAAVAIVNGGHNSLLLSVARVLSSPSDYSVESLVDPIEIPAGQSANLAVYFSPTASSAMESSATVSITYTDGGLNRDTTFVLNGTVATSAVHSSETVSAPITLSPNPSNTLVTLGGLEGINEVRILDAAGREVLLQKVSGARAVIDVSGLASGVYSAQLVRSSGAPDIQRLTIIH